MIPIFFAAIIGTVVASGRIQVGAGGHFVDSHGRVSIFHGVNVVYKAPPWHPSIGTFDAALSLSAEDIDNLHEWGFNAVRLGIMWPGVEPSKGNYSKTYLDVMRKLVIDLYERGIYTILDFHEDNMAQDWCGEGVPAWMTDMLKQKEQSTMCDILQLFGICKPFSSFHIGTDPTTGFPNTSSCLQNPFQDYATTREVILAWASFYSSGEVQELFNAYWEEVARTFADLPGVLGYDLINEPQAGDYPGDLTLLKPGTIDKRVLQPIYTKLGETILSVDPQAVLMYEPTPFPGAYPVQVPIVGGVHPVGFTSGPAKDEFTHQALSYHVYSCGFADPSCNREGDPKNLECSVCDKFALDSVQTRALDAKRLGGGAFLTEFGACSGSEKCLAEIKRVANSADTVFHSWAYWQFKYFHDITSISGPIEGFYTADGQLQQDKVAALSRTYAPRIAGAPLKMSYADDGTFRLQYMTTNSSFGAVTEIFLNEDMNYKGGYEVHATNATVEFATNRLYLTSPATANLIVDVAIVPHNASTTGIHKLSPLDGIAWTLTNINSSSDPCFELGTGFFWLGTNVENL